MNRAEAVDVVVIGGGQAGLSTSFHLGRLGVDHVVLEQDRVGASWRSQRWDSFCLVTPNWTVQLPGHAYQGPDPDGFMGRDDVVAYLEAYAASFTPPLRTGTRVTAVEHADGRFVVEAGDTRFEARAVVVATGSCRLPKLPAFSHRLPAGVLQLHSSEYRNPTQLPDGTALVVGTGQSGVQIAEELHEVGRTVLVSVSGCPRVPRRYRGKDIVWWGKMGGLYERTVETLESPAEKTACHPQSSGRRGGHDIFLRELANNGVRLLGRVESIQDATVRIAPDLSENLRRADEFAENVLKQLDQAVAKMGMPFPEDQNPRGVGAPVKDEQHPVFDLDLANAGVTSVIWATGYRADFSFVHLPVFDESGQPVQRRGATSLPGMFFVGLEWLHTPKSGLLLGVGEDAEQIASTIANPAKSESHEAEASV